MTASQPSHQGMLTGDPAKIEWVELTLRCDATITVGNYNGNATEWMKPGFEGKAHMSGMPNPDQCVAAYQYLVGTIVAPSLEALIAELTSKLAAAQMGNLG